MGSRCSRGWEEGARICGRSWALHLGETKKDPGVSHCVFKPLASFVAHQRQSQVRYSQSLPEKCVTVSKKKELSNGLSFGLGGTRLIIFSLLSFTSLSPAPQSLLPCFPYFQFSPKKKKSCNVLFSMNKYRANITCNHIEAVRQARWMERRRGATWRKWDRESSYKGP